MITPEKSDDYAVATRALAHWKKDYSKAEDYRQLIRELEDEVLEHLTGPRSADRHSPSRR